MNKSAIVIAQDERQAAANKIQTPETTKPLTSFEIRGFVFTEYGGEGEIRNYPFALFWAHPPGL